jgi:sarcosine oxidase subunit gamma
MGDWSLRVAMEIGTTPAMIALRARADDGPGRSAICQVLGLRALPATNTVALAQNRFRVLGLGPDEWLLLCLTTSGAELEREVIGGLTDSATAVCDVSNNRRLVRISGPDVWALLGRGCALPRDTLTAGRCAQTLFAHAPVLLVPSGDDLIELFVRTSYAEWLKEWLELRIRSHCSY